MSAPLLQSAQTLPVVTELAWQRASKPGAILAVPDSTVIGVDIAGFDRRDQQLAWRDVSLARAIQVVAAKAAQALQIAVPAPTLPACPTVLTDQEAALSVDGSGLASATLTGLVQPGSVVLLVDGLAVQDDGRGQLVVAGSCLGGSIDYGSGDLTVRTSLDVGAEVAATYKSVKYLEASAADVDVGQSAVPGGLSGVQHVDNLDVPDPGALRADKHLYRRDLVLYEVLQLAADIFRRLQLGQPYDDLKAASPVPATDQASSAWPHWTQQLYNQRWSRALGQESLAQVDGSLRWSPQVYQDPDRNLAQRDNALAWYVAQLSLLLGFQAELHSDQGPLLTERSVVITTETGVPILTERAGDVFTRTGSCELYERANRLVVRVVDSTPGGYLLTERGERILTELGTPLWIASPESLALSPAVDSPAVPTHWSREPVSYLLAYEDANYRVFQAAPMAGHGELRLIYDRLRRAIQWRTEQLEQVHQPREAAPVFEGLRERQAVEVVVDCPTNRDAAWCRQQAALWQPTGVQEELYQDVPMDQLDLGAGRRSGFITGGGLTLGQRAIFASAGSIGYLDFEADGRALEARQLWWGFNMVINPTIKVIQAASGYSEAVAGSGSFATSGYAVALPSSVQHLSWQLKLPPGGYRVKFQWADASNTRPKVQAQLKYAGQPIYGGYWQASSASEQASPAAVIQVAVRTAVELRLDLTPGGQAGGELTLLGFTLERLDVDEPAEVRLNLELCDRGGDTLTPITGTKSLVRTWLVGGQLEVAGTGWIDSALLADRYQVSLKVSLLDDPVWPLTIERVDHRRLVAVAQSAQPGRAAQLKACYLNQALSTLTLSSKRATQLEPEVDFRSSAGQWTAASTEAWLDRLTLTEPRVRELLRSPSPGDLGRPAVLPSGLTPDSGKIIAALGSRQATVELAPLQAWMLAANLPVVREAFWLTPPPEPLLQLVTDT